MTIVRPAAAQICPDGSRRSPDGRCGKAPSAPPVDPNRLAVLPFRVTGEIPALAHLREGLAELLPAHFNGGAGIEAIEPGEVIAAWNRARAGSAPATQGVARAVARQLGAGQFTYGSVTGNARRIIVTASIHSVPDGRTIVPQVTVEGTDDSLAVLVRKLATRLLAQREGALQVTAMDPGTTSNEAAGVYIDGMAAYRAARQQEAATRLRRAIVLDSTFTLAAYRLAILSVLYGPSGAQDDSLIWRRLWKQRVRLGGTQRLLLEAVADSTGLLSRMAGLPRLQRILPLLPNSAEAWDLSADITFHLGALLGDDDWASRAKSDFDRAVALDSTFLAIGAHAHQADLAFMDRDVRAHTRYAAARNDPLTRYQSAVLRGNPAAVRAARIEYVRDQFATARYMPGLSGIPWPPRELDSLLSTLPAVATTDRMRDHVAWNTASAASNFGRPDMAIGALRRLHGRDSSAVYFEVLTFGGDQDSIAAERSFAMLARGDTLRRLGRSTLEWACNAALSRLRRADTTGTAAVLREIRSGGESSAAEFFSSPRTRAARGRQVVCGEVLRGVLGAVGGADGAALHQADSLMRVMPMNCCEQWNHDLAVAFARRQEYAAAVAAVRRYWTASSEPNPQLAIRSLQEGRWSVLAGDTASAIRAYRRYLEWRENPEPALVPERDSARSALTALESAWRRNSLPRRH
jgi:hypothetical protein